MYFNIKSKQNLVKINSDIVFDVIANHCTVATDEVLCLKNVGTKVSMFFTENE